MLFKTKDEIKRRICDINTHKDIKIPVEIRETKKIHCYSSTKNACKLESVDHLWLPFIYQLQSDIVAFSVITFQIYNIFEYPRSSELV